MAPIETHLSFTCPRCGAESFNPHDVEEGYCNRCHDWTGSTADPGLDLSVKCRVHAAGGQHNRVDVFVGPDADHRALAGTLTLRNYEVDAIVRRLEAARVQ